MLPDLNLYDEYATHDAWGSAPCVVSDDPDAWFGVRSSRDAAALCEGCPMLATCYALGMRPENHGTGVWGGVPALVRENRASGWACSTCGTDERRQHARGQCQPCYERAYRVARVAA